MKFNWGTGIAIVIILFVLSIVYRIYLSYQQDINLTHNDYYAKGVEYQTNIEKQKNTLNLSEKISVFKISDSLIIQYPAFINPNEIRGTIEFFRPSDSKKDEKFIIKINRENKQKFLMKHFLKGRYQIIFEWSYQNKDYYQKEDFIN